MIRSTDGLRKADLPSSPLRLHRGEPSYVPVRPERGGPCRDDRDSPLAGLAGSSVGDRFRAWTGRSGRRYIFSVFALSGPDALQRLPVESPAVVIAVERGADGARRPLWVAETGQFPDAFFNRPDIAAFAQAGACEFHLHLLAATPEERQAALRDLAGL